MLGCEWAAGAAVGGWGRGGLGRRGPGSRRRNRTRPHRTKPQTDSRATAQLHQLPGQRRATAAVDPGNRPTPGARGSPSLAGRQSAKSCWSYTRAPVDDDETREVGPGAVPSRRPSGMLTPDKFRSDQARQDDGQPGRTDSIAIKPQCVAAGKDRGHIKPCTHGPHQDGRHRPPRRDRGYRLRAVSLPPAARP